MISEFNEANLYKGTVELLQQLKDKGMLIALGSASKNGTMLLEKMGIYDYFDYIVKPEEIPEGNGKPKPDIFLKAAEGLNMYPQDCIGIEDAYAGVTAVKSAGMFAIGIGTKKDLPHADIVYEEIGQIEIETIKQLL